MGGVFQNAYTWVGGKGVSHHIGKQALTLIFWQHVCLMVYYLQKFDLTSIQIQCLLQKRLFLSSEIGVCRHEILFLQTKVRQRAFNFSRIESQVYSLFHCDTLLYPLQRSAGNKVYQVRWILLLLMLLILLKNWSQVACVINKWLETNAYQKHSI